MKFFRIGTPSEIDYEWLNFVPPLEATDRIRAAGGQLLTEGWSPIDAELTLMRHGKRLPRADIQKNVEGLLIRESTYASLKPLLAGCGVPLPIRMAGDDPYLLFQVIPIDCLDQAKSEFQIVDNHHRWLRKPVLRADHAAGFNLFSPPGEPGFIFASETFRDAVTAAGFKGIAFREVPVT
jgi:hypothetical protein